MNSDPIMEQIQHRIQQKQLQVKKEAQVPFPDVVCPGKPTDIEYDVYLYQRLEQATTLTPQFARDMELTPSAIDKWPLIGALWHAIRRQLHSIALFYANRALTHQKIINQHLIEAVERVTAVTQQQQRTIIQLQAQLESKQAQK